MQNLLFLVRAAYCSSRVPWILLRNEVGYPQKYLNKMGSNPTSGQAKGLCHCACQSVKQDINMSQAGNTWRGYSRGWGPAGNTGRGSRLRRRRRREEEEEEERSRQLTSNLTTLTWQVGNKIQRVQPDQGTQASVMIRGWPLWVGPLWNLFHSKRPGGSNKIQNKKTIESRGAQPDWGTPRHELNKI